MSRLAKIRALHLGKKKEFRICLIIELIVLIAGVIGLFGKNNVYEYGAEEMLSNFGAYSEQQGGIVTDGSDGIIGEMVNFSGFVLPRGTYRAQLYYATDTEGLNTCTVQDSGLSSNILQTNGANLFSGLNHTDFDIWLYRDSRQLVFHVNYCGTGMLAVQGLKILQTNALNRMMLFWLLCFSTLINLVYCYVQYDRTYHISVKSKNVTFGMGLIILFSSLPLLADYIIGSGDLVYHLMRVEGIKDGILSGQFPIRISPEWLRGNGYASPIFYGETFLYLAAMFRLIGFTVTASYRMFMFVVTVATVLIAYHSFKKIFGEAYVGLFCSALYSLSIYRIYKTHITGSWGECFGVMLLPLILYGLWAIFTRDIREENYKRSWIPLTLGFTLLFQSHLLSCELAGFFMALVCLVLWKKTFRPQTFIVLVKAVVVSVLLSAWFMIPFLDYMLTGDFVIHHVSARTIQYRGLFPAHLLFTFFLDGGNVFYDGEGMAHSAATGVGIAPVAALVIYGTLIFTGRCRELKREERVLGGIAGALSLLAMLMSLNYFPWDRIQNWNSVTATLVSSIQFPNRFLTIANVGLTAVAGVVMKDMMSRSDARVVKAYVAGMLFLLTISSVYLQEGILDRQAPIRIYNSEGMGTGYIAGAEYLPYGTDDSLLLYHDPICTGSLQAFPYEKLSLGADVFMTNPGENAESATFPLLYYKGYCAYGEDGRLLDCYPGQNSQVTVDIPGGYNGNVRVRFVSPWYWRVGEFVTCATVSALALLYVKNRRYAGGRR